MSKSQSLKNFIDDIDMSSPDFYLNTNIHDVWKKLRQECPLVWHPALKNTPGFWVVTSYQLAVSVYKNSEVFSSSSGNIMETLLSGGDSAGGKMLPVSDGERHKILRKAISSYFSVSKLAKIKSEIKINVINLIKDSLNGSSFDFAEKISNIIPIMTICQIIGVPDKDRPLLYEMACKCISSEKKVFNKHESVTARNELLMYFLRLYKSRLMDTGSNKDDLLSHLIGLCDGELRMTQTELIYNCYSLLLGGDETTRLTLTGLVKLFCDYPQIWQELKEGSVSPVHACNEILRWTSVARHAGRTAMTDYELAGKTIERGDLVFIFNSSANFDETIFILPEIPDLNRTPNKHLSFGYGNHFCLGANLARFEIESLMEALRLLISEITLVSIPQPVYSTFLSGYNSLPVKLS
ncbi:cytochrome P450 [Erwinia mallotivora]|uniref:Cytochrome P450 n=1 Tax=Erwinia mallotivora TaxID=69222 RepID=A0A014PU33_9GAMM|nr:cytochrome P450 [Erwinia mallotivora]EXU74347.1 cytochrome P450 [Erwinia mallotivora]